MLRALSTHAFPSLNEPGVDLDPGSDLSNPMLYSQMRQKLDVMNRLHSAGLQLDIDLPQIAVIGNQSAGKSSLIVAISGITLPREAGTCTRCPTECRLARKDAPWQCIVSVRLTTDPAGAPLGQARTHQFGAVIFDKGEVEERIRRAQRAILNPSKPLDAFLTAPEADAAWKPSELAFSKNCITLQISGPDVTDLSFCDLPGLIASVGSSRGGNDGYIALVENLVTSYINKPSCIILLTVACETDFENQGAHRMAKAHDPEGKRTIGVLTKPDRIPLGEEPTWLPFVRNEKEPLENNWFVVKQPSTMELLSNISWARARKMEDVFFSLKAPWSDLEQMHKKYLGTNNLVARLSEVLSELIAERVPKIQDELERSVMHTRELISRLPAPPASDPRSDILTFLYTFTQDLSQHIKGVPDGFGSTTEPGLLQAIRPEQEKFKRAIRATAPFFWPFDNSTATHLIPVDYLLAGEAESFDSEGDDQVRDPHPERQKIFVDEVLRRAQSARTRELPGHYPFVVQTAFIEETVKQWEAPSEALCKSVHGTVSQHVKELVRKHFENFGQGRLEQQMRNILQQHVNECFERAEERLKWLRRIEDVPFTLNTHYLSDYKDKYFTLYKGARERYFRRNFMNKETIALQPSTQARSVSAANTSIASSVSSGASFPSSPFSFSQPSNTPSLPKLLFPPSNAPIFPATAVTLQIGASATAKVLSGLAELGMHGVTEEDLPKLLPPDRMEPALVIMADVRAYFQVAYKRFTDNVPLAIDVELVRGLENGIMKILFDRLGINGPKGDAICKELAQESRKVAERRVDLGKKLERLEAGQRELIAAFL